MWGLYALETNEGSQEDNKLFIQKSAEETLAMQQNIMF